jgi:hypothetical protein
MLVWTKESIPTSLTIIIDKLLVKEATRMFKSNFFAFVNFCNFEVEKFVTFNLSNFGFPSNYLFFENYYFGVSIINFLLDLLGWAGDKALSYPDVLAQEILSRGEKRGRGESEGKRGKRGWREEGGKKD